MSRLTPTSAAGRITSAPVSAQKGTTCPACGQARPNIKGGLDDRAIARVAEQSSGASNHVAIRTSPERSPADFPPARLLSSDAIARPSRSRVSAGVANQSLALGKALSDGYVRER
jgi:hypothetical protein